MQLGVWDESEVDEVNEFHHINNLWLLSWPSRRCLRQSASFEAGYCSQGTLPAHRLVEMRKVLTSCVARPKASEKKGIAGRGSRDV